MPNKNIVAFFEKLNIIDYLTSQKDYLESYQQLSNSLENMGSKLFIAGGQDKYLNNGSFQNIFEVTDNSFKPVSEIDADVVFDKGKFDSDNKVKLFNIKLINDLCTNKWLTYQTFNKFCPKTIFVNNPRLFNSALRNFKADMVVIKPYDGAEGRQVLIGDKSTIKLSDDYPFPLIIQEFMDSSTGIPGVMTGHHDFRIAVLNGEIAYSEYRTPPEGSYVASVALGGNYEVVDQEKIPTSALELMSKIEQTMSKAKYRLYAIDMIFTENGPKLVELNSRPGLLPNSKHPIFKEFKKKLATTLVNFEED